MLGARFLSLIALVAALFVARVVVGASVSSLDRVELPSGDGDDDSGDGGDAPDLALPSHPASTLTAVLSPPRRLVVEPEHAPATSPFASRIFRPPISALA